MGNSIKSAQFLLDSRLADAARGDADALTQAQAALEAAGFAVDYVGLADAETLAADPAADRPRRLLAAARLGGTRLIDNVAVE